MAPKRSVQKQRGGLWTVAHCGTAGARPCAPGCYHRHTTFQVIEVDGDTYDIANPVEGYTWEGSLMDCTIEESAAAVLPSTFVQIRARLTFDVRGPSWPLPDGCPAFVYLERKGTDGRALLVPASFLSDFLHERELTLMALHDFERNELKELYPADEPHHWVHVSSAALLNADLQLHVGTAVRKGTG
jgi:hypothetical protein